MRLLVLTSSFPSAPDDPSGHFVQASALELGRSAEVHVVSAGRRFGSVPERRGPLWVHWAGGGNLFGWPGAAARLRQAPWRVVGAGSFGLGVRRHLRELGPFDAAVAHWIVPCAWPLLAHTHFPLEAFAHGADVRLLCGLPSPLRAAVVRSLLARGARVRFAADSLRQRLLASLPCALAGRLEQASTVTPPALALPDVAELRAEAAALRRSVGLDPAAPDAAGLVVSAGRLVEGKRLDLALDSMALLEPPARFVVVGDGPERRSLEQRCRTLGLGASFLGRLPRPRTLAWLAAADVLLHTSEREAAPTVVREARALGTPVVCCPAGDLMAWAALDQGMVVSRPDPVSLAAALGRQLGTPLPPAAWSEIRRANRPTSDPGLRPRPLLGHARGLHR